MFNITDRLNAKLEVSSNPRVPLGRNNNIIPRPELLDKMKMVIGFSQSNLDEMDGDEGKGFSVIVGPSGTGKTVAVTHICNESPQGVLYVEVVSANSFMFDIAKEIGMKVAPSGIIDLILGHISDSYKLYHEIPEDKDRSLATIMNILQVAAEKFYAKHGKMPFLFIDGIDILAKKNEELVTCLLSHAKYLSNHDILKVVLISSKGSVMPLIEKFSGVNRA